MGKRRRNTAKTGDKAIYKAREDALNKATDTGRSDDDDDDPMYNEVDRYHNRRDEDFLKLDRGASDDSEDEQDQVEAVMDLAAGGESSDGEEESSSDDEKDQRGSEEEEESEEELSSSDDEDEMEMEDVRDWGKKKSAYYHGDTADLEIGQDEEDAFVEEEAAREVQAARYQDMSEEDFVLSDAEEDKKQSGDWTEELVSPRDVTKLSKKVKRKLLDKQHPELLPLLSYFSGTVKDLDSRTAVATEALFDGEDGTAEAVGATKLGQQYLLTKTLLQASTALNLAMYMLVKAEQSSEEDVDSSLIQSHPVMARLQKLDHFTQELENNVESRVDGLTEQLENLVKAATLMKSEGADDSGDESDDDKAEAADDDEQVLGHSNVVEKPDAANEATPSLSDDDEEESSIDEQAVSRNVLNEARFGLRANEIAAPKATTRGSRRPVPFDFGDDGPDEMQTAASRSLASTLNSIEQRSAARKRKAAPLTEDLDERQEDDSELRRGLEMMEAELGKDSEGEDGTEHGIDAELEDDDGDDNGFYSQMAKKSKSRKEFKKSLYAVAPKFPRVQPVIEGERAVSKTIMKNRGLVPHKPKINRNPRVKKRERYRKALIQRKGAVREVRTDEGHKYGGEETGIRTGITRSRKLVS